MADEADVLELLRSRLADLEAQQRSRGGTSDPAFWHQLTSWSPGSGPASSARPPNSSRPASDRGRSTAGAALRQLAAGSRPVHRGGPWSGVPLEALRSLDPREVTWLDAQGYAE